MAVYTDITDEELDALLADYDVGSAVAFKGIAEGVENSNFLLETDRGRFILTLYERRVKADELPYFLDLLTWLADHGFPSARPVADRQGRVLKSVRGKPAAMVEFLTGRVWPRRSPPTCSIWRRPGRATCRREPFTPTSSPTTSSSRAGRSRRRSTSISPATTPTPTTWRSR
jgi:homoserine kinase